MEMANEKSFMDNLRRNYIKPLGVVVDRWSLVKGYLREDMQELDIDIPQDLVNLIVSFYQPLQTKILTQIATNDLYEKVSDKLECDNICWKLIYRGTDDGFSGGQFWSKCDKIENVIVIIKTKDGDIFGGYTAKGFMKHNGRQHTRDDKAFLFGFNEINDTLFADGKFINDEKEVKTFDLKEFEEDYAIYFSPNHLCCFGENGEDILIEENCHLSRANTTNERSYNSNGGLNIYGIFRVIDIEIYKLL